MTTLTDAEAIAELLADHVGPYYTTHDHNVEIVCGCGANFGRLDYAPDGTVDRDAAEAIHRAHVAAAVAGQVRERCADVIEEAASTFLDHGLNPEYVALTVAGVRSRLRELAAQYRQPVSERAEHE